MAGEEAMERVAEDTPRSSPAEARASDRSSTDIPFAAHGPVGIA
jgi:hypothetical protein